MPATTAPVVVVAEFTAYCRNDHEITVVTDGRRVHAYTRHCGFTGPVTRDGVEFRVTCERPDRHDEPCDDVITVDQSQMGSWRRATDADAALLAQYGQPVDA